MISGAEGCAQLCVYVDDERVVDLYSNPGDKDYDADTVQNVFSSSKPLTSIVAATLVDKGPLFSFETSRNIKIKRSLL